jgi:hypothetical protein
MTTGRRHRSRRLLTRRSDVLPSSGTLGVQDVPRSAAFGDVELRYVGWPQGTDAPSRVNAGAMARTGPPSV